MSNFVFILLVEALLVLSVSLIVLLVFNWKKKKQSATEIEGLLAQIEENDASRKEQLVNYLTNQLLMEEQPAVELVEDFIVAEKRFTQQFLEIQLNQKSVSDFYQNSCEVLDRYLQLVAENLPKAINNDLDITGEASPEEKNDTNNSEQVEEKNKESEVKDTEPKNMDEALENLDSNEADQTPSSEAEPIEESNNPERAEDEFAEELDLDDAFAEAGVEMDESSEQASGEGKP